MDFSDLLPIWAASCLTGALGFRANMLHEQRLGTSTLKRGDHLSVRRSWGYQHHGVYISEDRVIQFGGRICDKPEATIGEVTLEEFADGGTGEVVQHPGAGRPFGLSWLPPADPPDLIVQRAEWLLAHHPTRRYNLVGWNCEHAANFCMNEYTESLQARRFFQLKVGLDFALFLYVTARRCRGKTLVWAWPVVLLSFATTSLYHIHIRRFWRDIGHHWRAYEQTLPKQPVRTGWLP